MATPGPSNPPPVSSGAIHKGADLLVALIGVESDKAAAEARKALADLERRFSELQHTTQTVQTAAKLRIDNAEALAAKRVNDAELSATKRINDAELAAAKKIHDAEADAIDARNAAEAANRRVEDAQAATRKAMDVVNTATKRVEEVEEEKKRVSDTADTANRRVEDAQAARKRVEEEFTAFRKDMDTELQTLSQQSTEKIRQLEKLHSVLQHHDIALSEGGALEFHGTWPLIVAELTKTVQKEPDPPRLVTPSLDPSLLLDAINQRAEEQRLAIEEWKCRLSEAAAERDGVKESLEAEVYAVKRQLTIVEAKARELEALKSRTFVTAAVQASVLCGDIEVQTVEKLTANIDTQTSPSLSSMSVQTEEKLIANAEIQTYIPSGSVSVQTEGKAMNNTSSVEVQTIIPTSSASVQTIESSTVSIETQTLPPDLVSVRLTSVPATQDDIPVEMAPARPPDPINRHEPPPRRNKNPANLPARPSRLLDVPTVDVKLPPRPSWIPSISAKNKNTSTGTESQNSTASPSHHKISTPRTEKDNAEWFQSSAALATPDSPAPDFLSKSTTNKPSSVLREDGAVNPARIDSRRARRLRSKILHVRASIPAFIAENTRSVSDAAVAPLYSSADAIPGSSEASTSRSNKHRIPDPSDESCPAPISVVPSTSTAGEASTTSKSHKRRFPAPPAPPAERKSKRIKQRHSGAETPGSSNFLSNGMEPSLHSPAPHTDPLGSAHILRKERPGPAQRQPPNANASDDTAVANSLRTPTRRPPSDKGKRSARGGAADEEELAAALKRSASSSSNTAVQPETKKTKRQPARSVLLKGKNKETAMEPSPSQADHPSQIGAQGGSQSALSSFVGSLPHISHEENSSHRGGLLSDRLSKQSNDFDNVELNQTGIGDTSHSSHHINPVKNQSFSAQPSSNPLLFVPGASMTTSPRLVVDGMKIFIKPVRSPDTLKKSDKLGLLAVTSSPKPRIAQPKLGNSKQKK